MNNYSEYSTSDSTAYTWVPELFLNEKQCGIQSAHCISDMSLLNNTVYQNWATHHKRLIMFKGTNCGNLRRVFYILYKARQHLAIKGLDIPVVKFNEDAESLDGAITAVGMVFPNALRINTRDYDINTTEYFTNLSSIETHNMEHIFNMIDFATWMKGQRLV